MRRVLVVTGVAVEAHALGRHLGLARERRQAGLWYRGDTLDVACAGPGALHLERLVDLARRADLVASAGTCGALAPHLRIGDLVIPAAVLTVDGDRCVLRGAPGLPAAGSLLSVETVAEDARSKAQLWRDTGALAVDMETARIAAWAAALGREAVSVRAVSDTAGHGVPLALARAVDGEGRTHAARAAAAILAHPRLFARALSLRRGTAIALRAVAGAIRTASRSLARDASDPDSTGRDGEWDARADPPRRRVASASGQG